MIIISFFGTDGDSDMIHDGGATGGSAVFIPGTGAIKRIASLVFALLLLLAPGFVGRAESRRKLTIMVYMCGSNLESQGGAASADLREMTEALRSEDVGILVLTGGSEKWSNGIESDGISINRIGLRNGAAARAVVDRLAPASMGDPDTLAYFLDYAVSRLPAEKYGLILWDHGNGPMEGMCIDELFQPDVLTVEELSDALAKSAFSRDKLEWIGFDACLMESVEIALQVAPYARYMIGSEETEPESGWDYGFLDGVDADADGAETGRRIVDRYIGDAKPGEFRTLSCIDLSRVGELRERIDRLFSLWQDDVDPQTYSALARQRKAIMGYGMDVARSMRDHDLVDLGDLIATLSPEKRGVGREAAEAIDSAVTYNASTMDGSCGLSVYFPYYNKESYAADWKAKYESFGMGDSYTGFIRSFGEILVGKPLADWRGLPLGLYAGAREERSASMLMNLEGGVGVADLSDEPDDGIITAEDIRNVREGMLVKAPLTDEQQAAFASARLLVMEKTRTFLMDSYRYRLVYTSPALDMDSDGAVRAMYREQTLHVVDRNGKSIVSEVSYNTLDNGEIAVDVAARSGYGGDSDEIRMVMTFRMDDDGVLERSGLYVYNPLTDSYDRRSAYDAGRYPYIAFPDRYLFPVKEEGEGRRDTLEWRDEDDFSRESVIRFSDGWRLEFRTTSDARALAVCMELTDTQNNRHYTEMRTINTGSKSPDLIKDGIFARILAEGMEVKSDGISVNLTMIGSDHLSQTVWVYAPTVNGRESAFVTQEGFASFEAVALDRGSSVSRYLKIDAAGADEVVEIGMRFSYICPMDVLDPGFDGSNGLPMEMCTRVFSGPAKILPNAPVPVTETPILLTAPDFSTVWGTSFLETLNRPSLNGVSPIAREMLGEMTILGGFAEVPPAARGYDAAFLYAGTKDGDRLDVSRIGECVDAGGDKVAFMIPGKRVSLLAGETALPLCVAKDYGTGLPYSISSITFYIGDTAANIIDNLMTLGSRTVRELAWEEGFYGVEFSQSVATSAFRVPTVAASSLESGDERERRADVDGLPVRLRCEDAPDESMYAVFLDRYQNVLASVPVYASQVTKLGSDVIPASMEEEMARTDIRVTRTQPAGNEVVLWQIGDWIVRKTYGGVRLIGYVGSQSRISVPETLDGKAVIDVVADAFDGRRVESIDFPSTVRHLDGEAFGASATQSAVVFRRVSQAVFVDLDTSPASKDSLALYSDGTLTVDAPIDDVTFEEDGSVAGVISVKTGNATEEDDADSLEHYPYSALIRAVEKWGFRHVRFDDAEILWLPPMMYRRTESGDWAVLSYGGEDSEVFIPAEADGRRVTDIDDHAFQRNRYRYARSIGIGEGVETIGEKAFAGSSVEEITLPRSLKRVAPDAFAGCGMLRRVTIKCDPAILPDGLFASCPLLKAGVGALAMPDEAGDDHAARLLGTGGASGPGADVPADDLLGYWESSAIYDGNGTRWPGGDANFSITLHENGTFSGWFMGRIQGRWTAQDGAIRAGDMLLVPGGARELTVYRNYWRIVCAR